MFTSRIGVPAALLCPEPEISLRSQDADTMHHRVLTKRIRHGRTMHRQMGDKAHRFSTAADHG